MNWKELLLNLRIGFRIRFAWNGGRMWKHFKDEEVVGLQNALVERLDLAREYAGIPFRITSGYREPEKNLSVGGVADSAHMKGLASDIACDNSHDRFIMVKALIAARFTRIVIYPNHLHVDIDPNKVPEVLSISNYKESKQ